MTVTIRYLDEDQMRRHMVKENRMQEMYQHLSGAPLQGGEKEDRVDYLDTLRQQQGLGEQQLRVGDRVRLKGDDEGRWMTIKRIDMLEYAPDQNWPGGRNRNTPQGTWCHIAYWTKNDAGGPFLVEMGGFRPECLTKEPPPSSKRPSWGRTVKTPAASKKAVTRAKKR